MRIFNQLNMGNNFFTYLNRLELMVFFSGYPLLYAVIVFAASQQGMKNAFIRKIDNLLPLSYAVVGLLYFAFELKKLYPDYSMENIKHYIQQSWLSVWALLALLFCIPAISKRKIWTLIHSSVFFSFLVIDLFSQFTQPAADNAVIDNDMKVYGWSIMINLFAFILIVFLSFLFTRYKARKPLVS